MTEAERPPPGPSDPTPYRGAISWAHGPPEGQEVPSTVVARAVQVTLAHGGGGALVVDVVFVSKEALASMHGQFLGDPGETDVITFDLRDDDDPSPVDGRRADPEPEEEDLAGAELGPRPIEAGGELYVSVDRALEASRERGVAFERELVLYVVHGTLHLCGFDDHGPADREAMRAAERAVMGRLGYPEDLAPHDA